jgi:hypothetical protein
VVFSYELAFGFLFEERRSDLVSSSVHGLYWDLSFFHFWQIKNFLFIAAIEGAIGVTIILVLTDCFSHLITAFFHFLQSLINIYKCLVFLFLSDAVAAAVCMSKKVP